ncbi:MAG: hypothetical protein R3D67_11565 [Hyphomicrobiaceae bacterium]
MQVDWENLFKRYVYNETKTPYFVSVSRLNRLQADNEIFVYCLLQAILFAVLGVASVARSLPHHGSPVVTLIALGLCAAAIVFWATKHPFAAASVVVAPVAGLAYFWAYGFHPRIGEGDKVLLVIVMGLWLLYNWRMLSIARLYPEMPEPPPREPPRGL